MNTFNTPATFCSVLFSSAHSGWDVTQNLSIDFTKAQVASQACKGVIHMIMLCKEL